MKHQETPMFPVSVCSGGGVIHRVSRTSSVGFCLTVKSHHVSTMCVSVMAAVSGETRVAALHGEKVTPRSSAEQVLL